MARARKKDAEAAWARIEALGGHGVWEPDMVVVDLAGTAIEDDDLELFHHFPDVQILNLSRTLITDDGLKRLEHLPSLEKLVVLNTQISADAIERFRRIHPDVEVQTSPLPKGTTNPLTGEPL